MYKSSQSKVVAVAIAGGIVAAVVMYMKKHKKTTPVTPPKTGMYGMTSSAPVVSPTMSSQQTPEPAEVYDTHSAGEMMQTKIEDEFKGNLMPQSWKGDGVSSSDSWAKYAPTKQSHARYVAAAGSSRLSLNSRSALGRITGQSNMFRAHPPATVSASEFVFGDSSFRQQAIKQATDRFPVSTNC